jgi:hypothetical protein
MAAAEKVQEIVDFSLWQRSMEEERSKGKSKNWEVVPTTGSRHDVLHLPTNRTSYHDPHHIHHLGHNAALDDAPLRVNTWQKLQGYKTLLRSERERKRESEL